MIGNDIVDLRAARSHARSQDLRYWKKILTGAEMQILQAHSDGFVAAWLFWAIKESTYKLAYRSGMPAKFNPWAFECTSIGKEAAEVRHEQQLYKVRFKITDQYIVANAFQNLNYHSATFPVASGDWRQQRQDTYDQAIELYAESRGDALHNFSIVKGKRGIPSFYCRGKQQQTYLSLSHHGHYGACAFTL